MVKHRGHRKAPNKRREHKKGREKTGVVKTMTRPGRALLRFLGATGTVTGSRFLVDTPSARILVDCGLFQGLKPLRELNWAEFPVDPASIDAVALTHAHVDHCGYLPALVRKGFAGRVLATEYTCDLSAIVLPDSGHLHEEEARYANRRGYSKHSPARPLYTEADAIDALGHFAPAAFDQPVEIAAGIRATFRRAGHILGSSTIAIEVDDPTPRTILFTGDLGRPEHPILRPPAPRPDADFILTESTYGDRRHEDSSSLELFETTIHDTAERGGVAVIPSFAVDRTEVILWHLRRLMHAGRIPSLPVYVDSPMALATLKVYRRALAEGSEEIREELRGAPDPFDPGRLIEAKSVEESMAINDEPGPAIIVSASGMATGGRVLHHIRRLLPDPKNSLILVGFQADGTRGRRLLNGEPTLKMFGAIVPVRAHIANVPAFSVHADQQELVDWLGTGSRLPRTAFVVHGEPASAQALRDRLDSDLGWNATVPKYLEQMRLN